MTETETTTTDRTLTAAELDELTVTTIRTLAMDAVESAQSGHPGTPMGAAPLAWTIFSRFLRYDPADPDWPDRDRFVLSAGHASMLLYSLLHITGYDLSLEDIRGFRQWGSRTPGHPEHELTPGVEVTTGPLGQGFGMGVGMAMAERLLADRFNRDGYPIVDHRVFALCSDGDVMEGISHEAASLAGHLRLGKLVYCWDDNRITIDGSTDLAFSEDVTARFRAYGWHTLSVEDGQDAEALTDALEEAVADERPSLIRVRTHIAWGAPTKQDTAAAHGSALGAEEVRATKEAYGWDPDLTFHVPEEVREHGRRLGERGTHLHREWRELLAAWGEAHPDLAREWERTSARRLPEDLWDRLPDFAADEKVATRKASGAVINALAGGLPELTGGSADLTGSNKTEIEDAPVFTAARPGRYVHYGVREHAMAAALNGMARHGGIRPFGGTFLIFSDYMRPAVRLAALQATSVVFVFTHDSIGLGEDGPTHQPIEHLASLRAMPNLTVLRPADASEVPYAWRAALERDEGPTALVLARQGVPVIDRERYAPAEGTLKGAYVLAEASGGAPEGILIGTGSEVALCLEAREALEADGLPTRVVSMPSWELFDRQPEEYRREVLPPEVRGRVAVETGSPHGWERYVGDAGSIVGLERFGASAPGPEVQSGLGFTVERVVQVVRETLRGGAAGT